MSSGCARRQRDMFAATAWIVSVFLLLSSSLRGQTSDFEKTRKIAAIQHEMVINLIEKKEFAKAAEEANKIFQLKWPDDLETVLKDELLRLSGLFHHSEQNAVALQLVEKNLGIFKSAGNRADLLKEKAYLHELKGEHDKALQCLREAKELLEKKHPFS
jgi:tetratricopeptide (TPR) repeat protein